MSEQFNWSQAMGGRPEYAEMSADTTQSTTALCDLIDDVLHIPVSTETQTRDIASSTENGGMTMDRSFNYLESNLPSGLKWPLAEKTIHIHYERMGGRLTQELFRIAVGTKIHQTSISQEPILDIYEFNIVGPQATIFSNIEEPDIVGISDSDYTTRSITPYDRATLTTELTQLKHLLEHHAADSVRSAQL